MVALRAEVLSALRAASSRPGPPSATGLRPLRSGALVLGGAPPLACVFSAPGHSCSGALRPWPGEPAAGSAAPCAREPLRSAPSGRWLRRPPARESPYVPGPPAAGSGRTGPASSRPQGRPLRRFINVNPQIYKCKFTDINWVVSR